MPRMDLKKSNRLGMAAVLGMEGYTRTHVAGALAELIKLRASHLNGCTYCIDLHTAALRKRGETPARIEALAGDLPSDLFTAPENAALALTDETTRLAEGGVSDATWANAAAHYSERELGDLVLAIATINVWNRIGIATQLDR